MRWFLSSILVVVSIAPALVACRPREVMSTPQQIAEVQSRVPFQIVLPTYLPDNLGPYPRQIDLLRPDPGKQEFQTLLIHYRPSFRSDKEIVIQEENGTGGWQGSSLEAVFLDVNGVKVLQQPVESYPQKETPDLMYGWSSENITLRVDSAGYPATEMQKMVESMVKATLSP